MKSESKHTPGPWTTTGKYDDAADGILVNCKSDGFTYTAAIVPAFKGHPSEEQEANARLIAQTPQLLVALKNLHATAQAVIVHLESQPVVLDFIKSKLPASWPMFEECTSQASDVIAEVGEV